MSKKLAESLTAGQKTNNDVQIQCEQNTAASISVKTLDAEKTNDKSAKKKKKRLGKCKVCGENTAKARCIKCDTPVCSSCYVHLIGICTKCLPKHTGDKWKGRAMDWEKTLGVEWIE